MYELNEVSGRHDDNDKHQDIQYSRQLQVRSAASDMIVACDLDVLVDCGRRNTKWRDCLRSYSLPLGRRRTLVYLHNEYLSLL